MSFKSMVVTKTIKCKVCRLKFLENYNAGYHYHRACSMPCFIAAGHTLSDLENIPEKRKQATFYRRQRKNNSTPKTKKNFKRARSGADFYRTDSWRKLRYKVLAYYGSKCMLCKTEKGSMHVDHIKSRSKFPQLELDFNNLQVLCRDCNMGKSAWDDHDFRGGKTWGEDPAQEKPIK